MKLTVYIIGLVIFLFGSSVFAAEGSRENPDLNKKKKPERVCPSPKYGGQEKEKSNNGHGNNKDDVDRSNPGKKPATDSDPNVDDENK